MEKLIGKRKSLAYSAHTVLTAWSREGNQRSQEIKVSNSEEGSTGENDKQPVKNHFSYLYWEEWKCHFSLCAVWNKNKSVRQD